MSIRSMHSRTRSWSSAVVAVAALGAPLAFAPTSAAEPFVANPFAGTFICDAAPGQFFLPGGDDWTITVKGAAGKTKGTIDVDNGLWTISGSCSGSVDRDGNVSIRGVQGWFYFSGGSVKFDYNATATLDADDNIVVTLETGETLLWVRQ